MSQDWQELTRLTRSKPIVIERIRIPESDIAIEGRFELPSLARLSIEDRICYSICTESWFYQRNGTYIRYQLPDCQEPSPGYQRPVGIC